MLDIQLSLNANILQRVCSYKYLGLHEHLTYNKRIKELNKLVWNAINANTRNLAFIDFKLHQKKCLIDCFMNSF